ncbi:hypothetical protein BDY24DRAFT_438499 [Mrakia frigida]|uniref:uncharacterized protein n=1 Tax=Mrakia frigida TaxID=29902 RepID=UPI003FCC1898
MTADLNDMDNSLSAASLPQTTKPIPSTYSLPTTPESNLSLATKLTFAKDSLLFKLGLGIKSEAQLEEEKLEKKREEERTVRMLARQKQMTASDYLAGAINGADGGMGAYTLSRN